jgi:hypothetical protein
VLEALARFLQADVLFGHTSRAAIVARYAKRNQRKAGRVGCGRIGG